jgi:predicted HTH transcriptional regulator
MQKESQNIEWKETWHNDHFKWICGFANAKGGRLFIGKDNKGHVNQLANANKLLEDLPNLDKPEPKRQEFVILAYGNINTNLQEEN